MNLLITLYQINFDDTLSRATWDIQEVGYVRADYITAFYDNLSEYNNNTKVDSDSLAEYVAISYPGVPTLDYLGARHFGQKYNAFIKREDAVEYIRYVGKLEEKQSEFGKKKTTKKKSK